MVTSVAGFAAPHLVDELRRVIDAIETHSRLHPTRERLRGLALLYAALDEFGLELPAVLTHDELAATD